jgi:anti-anti-sigma factor
MPLILNPSITGNVARLELVGDVDGSTAPLVRDAVDKLLSSSPQALILQVEKVAYMSSAGLRVLIFAKQKSPNLTIYVVKPQAPIIDTLKKTGFYDGVYVTETEPDAGVAPV